MTGGVSKKRTLPSAVQRNPGHQFRRRDAEASGEFAHGFERDFAARVFDQADVGLLQPAIAFSFAAIIGAGGEGFLRPSPLMAQTTDARRQLFANAHGAIMPVRVAASIDDP